jgi:hypothetical protein
LLPATRASWPNALSRCTEKEVEPDVLAGGNMNPSDLEAIGAALLARLMAY